MRVCIKRLKGEDNLLLKYLYNKGYRISSQDLEETTLDRTNSKITILVKR